MTKLRFIGLITVLAVAASIAAATAQTQTRSGQDGSGSPGLKLTYTKWIAPSLPNLVGVVGGDIVGTFSGAVYEKTGPDSNGLVHLTAIYIVIAPDSTQSFTAHVEGIENLTTRTAVLDGRVVDGYLNHAHIHVEFNIVTPCAQAPSGTCFQGTINVSRSAND